MCVLMCMGTKCPKRWTVPAFELLPFSSKCSLLYSALWYRASDSANHVTFVSWLWQKGAWVKDSKAGETEGSFFLCLLTLSTTVDPSPQLFFCPPRQASLYPLRGTSTSQTAPPLETSEPWHSRAPQSSLWVLLIQPLPYIPAALRVLAAFCNDFSLA